MPAKPLYASKNHLGWTAPGSGSKFFGLESPIFHQDLKTKSCGWTAPLAQETTARPAPLAMSGKRKKTDEVDMEHVQDVLLGEGKRSGMEGALNFRSFNVLTKQQAISGRDLACSCEVLEELKDCSDQLFLKYTSLKGAFTMVLRKHPVILARFDMAQREREYKARHFAKLVMTPCTHVRRLKDEQKFREACRGLPSFSGAKLQRLRNLVCTSDSPVGNVQAGKPSSSAATVPGRHSQKPGNASDSEHPGSEAEKPGKASGSEAQEPGKAKTFCLCSSLPHSNLTVMVVVGWKLWMKALFHPGKKM